MSLLNRQLNTESPHHGRAGGKRGLIGTLCFTILLMVSAIVANSHLQGIEQAEDEPEEIAEVGLRGVLPEDTPEELSLDAFLDVPEYLQGWMEDVAMKLDQLYLEELTLPQQRELLATLFDKLEVMERGIDNPKQRDARQALITLSGRLKRRLEMAQAVLDTLEPVRPSAKKGSEPSDDNTAPANPELRDAIRDLLQAVEDFEALGARSAGTRVREALEVVQRLAPDQGEKISFVVRRYYMNFNLHLVISEQLMNGIVADHQQTRGPVRDYVLGASVYGNQSTKTSVGVDIKPSRGQAVMNLTLTGLVHSNTVGVTPQANIYTYGQHQFWARKPVTFDGKRLGTNVAELWVQPNNYTQGAKTNLSWIPLLGHIADNIAVSEANKRRPQSQAIAAQKIRDRVLPEFEREIATTLAQQNAEMQKSFKRLEDNGYATSAQYVVSSETHVRYTSRLMEPMELGGERVAEVDPPNMGMLLQIHESLLNNGVDRMDIAGRTMTEDELGRHIQQEISQITGKPVKIEEKDPNAPEQPEGPPITFEFDEEDPVRFRVEKGEVVLIIQAGLVLEIEEEDGTKEIRKVSPRRLRIPLIFNVQGNRILIETGQVQASAMASGRDPDFKYNKFISIKMKEGIKPEPLNAIVELSRGEGKLPLKLTVSSIQALNGWLSITLGR